MMIDTCERLEALASTKESICFLLYVSQKCLHVNTLDSAKGIKDHNFNIESTELDPILFLLTKVIVLYPRYIKHYESIVVEGYNIEVKLPAQKKLH